MKVDFVRYLNAVTRRVEDGTRENRPAKIAVMSCVYDTDVADLWDAVTNPERIARWFLPVSGELKAGGHFQLEGHAGGDIMVCEAPRILEVTWCFGEDKSWVNLKLSEETGRKARLELRHIAHIDERWNQFGPGAVGVGWDGALLGLSMYLSGAHRERQEIAAWSAGEDGKRFYRRSSGLWSEAAVQAGADRKAAKAAEERTTAFYTGMFTEKA